jgi:integrase
LLYHKLLNQPQSREINVDEIKVSLLWRKAKLCWYMQYRHPETGRKVQKSSGKTNRRDAEREASKWEQKLRSGADDRLGRMEWASFRTRYEDEVLPGLAETTAKKVGTVFDAVERVLHPQRIGNVTTDAMARLVKALRDNKRSENTIKGYLAHLCSSLSWAVTVGLLASAPKAPKIQRAKGTRVMKGRPITAEEMERMIEKVETALIEPMDNGRSKKQPKRWTEKGRKGYEARRKEQAANLAASWTHLIRGLWWSGLRLAESLELHWTDDTKLCVVDINSKDPMLQIPAALEKGNKDRLLPIAPEFARFLQATPEDQREGYVFSPAAMRADKKGQRLGEQQVGRIIGVTGKLANVKVGTGKTGKPKMASAHDLRRSFGLRWAQRVMPQILMELMRHESIDTTMLYYVGRNAKATSSILRDAERHATGDLLGDPAQEMKKAD